MDEVGSAACPRARKSCRQADYALRRPQSFIVAVLVRPEIDILRRAGYNTGVRSQSVRGHVSASSGGVEKLQRDRERAMRALRSGWDSVLPVSISPVLTRVLGAELESNGDAPWCPAQSPRDASLSPTAVSGGRKVNPTQVMPLLLRCQWRISWDCPVACLPYGPGVTVYHPSDGGHRCCGP